MCYVELDGNGNQIGNIHEVYGSLSDCDPIVIGQKLIWYTWLSCGTTFYEIDINNIFDFRSQLLVNGKKYTFNHTKEKGRLIESNYLDTAIKYDLYDNGNLYIYGWGKMKNSTHQLNNDTRIKNVYIEPLVTFSGRMFNGCTELQSASLPDSNKSISDQLFYGCSGLKNVMIPESVTSIENHAFSNCSGLTSLTIPESVTNIGAYAFSYCSGLKSLTIPKSVTEIEEYTFAGCYGLKSLPISDSVTSIGNHAFAWCHGLDNVTIPNSVTNIGDYAFYNCSGLKNVTIPGSVTNIGDYAFAWSHLTSMTIPNSVISIGNNILSDSQVSHIYYAGTQQQWKKILSIGSLGKDDITIHYNSSGPTVSSIAVKKLPTKMTYTVGQKFDPTGMIVKVTYADGTTKEITSGYTYTPTGAMNTVGQQTIAIAYKESGVTKGTGFKVTVNKAMSSITIKKLPAKMTYTLGEKFDPTGMIVKVNYADGTTKEITSGYTYTPTGAMNTAGQQKIVVTYGGKSTGFKVTVNEKTMSSISIKKLPAKMTYTLGEKFDPTGMTVKVNYSDGTTKEITSGYTYTPTGAMNTAGQQTIAVAYKESGVTKGTGFKVTVNDKTVSSITIKKLPSKMTYTVGEKFDPTGMIVKVNYTDGTSREITSGYTYTPTGAMNTAGKQTIAVAYKANGVTKGTGFKVTVNEKTVSSITIKKLPKKMTYTVGEKFDPTGMIVKVNYSDGTSKEITSGYTYTPTGAMNTAGQQTIAVAYKESGVTKGTGFKVTVNG